MICSVLFVLAFALYFTIRVELPPIYARYKALDAELRNICPIVATRQTFLDELWSGKINQSIK